MQIRDVVGDVPYRFRPVVHLRTGGVMALEVHTRAAADDADHVRPVTGLAGRSVRLDVGFTAEAARRAHKHGMLLPLHLSLWADTVCAEHDPLPPLRDTVADLGCDPSQVVIRLVVAPDQAPPGNLEDGLTRLRAAGFGLGLDAAGTYPMITLIDVRPEVLLLAARHTAGLPSAPRARAALASAITLAEQTGATLIADGCDTAEHATALRAQGVYQVQGQLLGPSQQRPRTQPIPAVVLDRRTSPASTDPTSVDIDPRRPVVAADLAHPAAALPLDTIGDTARTLFAHRPELTGLVLVDEEHHPLLSLNRDRFMLAITGPFGHSLHAKRPAAGLADPPRTLHLQTSLAEAIDMVADTPTEHIYDDIIVTDHQGRCQGVLRIRDLVRDLAQRQDRPPPHLTAAGLPGWSTAGSITAIPRDAV